MMTSRLDGVLARNRSNVLADLALAAFMLMVMVFGGVTFGSVLPKLSSAPRAVPAELAAAADAAAENAQAVLDVPASPSGA